MGKKEDRRFTKPNLKLVNKASLDRVLKAEIYVNEADGQLRAAHLILGYTPLSFALQVPKCVIRARYPRLHRISVDYKRFIVPEGVSSSQPVLREEEVEEKEEEEEEEEEVVELSDSSEDNGVFYQPIRSEEDLDEMEIQRKPQRSLMELIENQPGKNVPGKSMQSQIPSLPTRSPPPAPHPPSHHPPQPVRADAAELKRRREQKRKDAVIQNTFKLDEMLNCCYSQLDDERKQQALAIQTLTQSEQDLAAARKKLLAEEQARKCADSALEGFQKQAEDQGKRLHEANAKLKAAREQIAVLKKHLEETQKLREQAKKSREEAEKAKAEAEQATNEAEQKGYEIGVAKTEETLRAEVTMVCRIYCAQTWDETLNRAGVEASSELRRPENVFYPEAICTSALSSSQAEDNSSTINPNEEVLPPSLPPPGQLELAKENNAPPEVSLDKTTTASEAEVASQGF
ncbi:uncharacterized protein DDB_G0286299-like [Quercus lobata]|uniref:uncharacterized protein DDB_G0286299-like n=1 Tax=Quercus lobata TaxID=97700 RepID=UPI001247D578|nr:uncharacterized protein DDB_G0286299-like [Quercus lobata]